LRTQFLAPFFGVNLLQATIGNALLGLLIDAPGVVQGSVASAAVWLLWYGVIRVWQWRRESSRPGLPHIVP